MKPVLELKRVDAVSSAGSIHLQDISLTLEPGQIGVIAGGPRAGKSLLLQVIAGEHQPASGEVFHRGNDVTSRQLWKRRKNGLALASQSPPRFDSISAEAQISLGLGRKSLPAKHKRLLLDLLPEAAPLLSTPMVQLSHQAHRLIDIGSCLVLLPSVMMIDEPAVDFGPERALAIAQSLRAADIALLIADRYAAPMLEIADKGWLLRRGRIAEEGSGPDLAALESVQAACLGEDI